MKPYILTIFLCTISLCTAQEATIRVHWSKRQQRIVGLGGTMGWIHPHPDNRKQIFDLLFNDLGASLLRIRALGSEQAQEQSAEQKNDNDDPCKLALDKFGFRQTEAANAVLIKGATKRGVKLVIPTAWSPPAWMKDTGKRAGGGSLKKGMTDEYAELWLAYVLTMKKDFGIDITHLSIQNEPDIQYTYPTCGFTPKRYAQAIRAVQDRLNKAELNVQVLGPDCCRIYNMPDYVDAMLKAKAYSKGPILTHLYDLDIPFEIVRRDAVRWQKAAKFAARHKRGLWLMETANYLSNTKPATYKEAFIWAQKLHHALVDGSCEVACYWALYFDKPGEALIYAEESNAREFKITPKYYTSKNFYRHIRPGMHRYSVRTNNRKLLPSAYQDDKQRTFVIVNLDFKAVPIRVPALAMTQWTGLRTSKKRNCEPIRGTGDRMKLEPRSVTTLIVKRR